MLRFEGSRSGVCRLCLSNTQFSKNAYISLEPREIVFLNICERTDTIKITFANTMINNNFYCI